MTIFLPFINNSPMWTSQVTPIQEDDLLKACVLRTPRGKWKLVCARMRTRFGITDKTPKQCRDRWINYVDPKIIKTRPWSMLEDQKLLVKYKEYGSKWANLSEFFPGRSEGIIKNRFYCIVRKNIRRYNLYKPEEEQIKGNAKSLLNDPLMVEILVAIPKRKYLRVKRKANIYEDFFAEAESFRVICNKRQIEEERKNSSTEIRADISDSKILLTQGQKRKDKLNEFCEDEGQNELLLEKELKYIKCDKGRKKNSGLSQSDSGEGIDLTNLRLPDYEFRFEFEYRNTAERK
jgi:hypothetical protein